MPISTTGWVYVSSCPGGASVTLDGANYGQTHGSGSLKLNTIAIGEHTVTLTLAGYQPYSTRVTVYVNTVSEVSAILQSAGPKAGVGEVSVSSTPADANVFIDNNFVGITPLTLKAIPTGTHAIMVWSAGYQDYEVTTEVNAGATSTVVAGLSPATPTTPQRSGSIPPCL